VNRLDSFALASVTACGAATSIYPFDMISFKTGKDSLRWTFSREGESYTRRACRAAKRIGLGVRDAGMGMKIYVTFVVETHGHRLILSIDNAQVIMHGT
jgi:hypothetical protein